MTKYGKVAVRAHALAVSGADPREAWRAAALQEFPTSESSRKKGCPRGAFLGLCEAGLLTGIPATGVNHDAAGGKNAVYAVTAVELLREDPSLRNSPLWWPAVLAALDADASKVHNGQLDVARALIECGAIVVGADG